MRAIHTFMTALLVGLPLAPHAGGTGVSAGDELTERLRRRIETAGLPAQLEVGTERIHASMALPAFYERRGFRPAWLTAAGPGRRVDELIRAVAAADREGLRPEDYHLERLAAVLAEVRETLDRGAPPDPGRLTDLELLLTDAFLLYGSHLLMGRIDPNTLSPEWRANRRNKDLAAVLEAALDSGSIASALEELLPPQPGYHHLRDALARYREIAMAGGWPAVPGDGVLRPGSSGERVALLRARLTASGDLAGDRENPGDVYDDDVVEAVRRFQRRNGLDSHDGIVGPATLRVLNIPVEERIRQIRLNMERWRWLPQDLGPKHVLVNIADFRLAVVEGGKPTLTMRVMVGKPYRRTPVFSDRISYLVFNPYWTVPAGILDNDILPGMRRDAGFAAAKNLRVLRNGDGTEVDPRTVDWSKISAKRSPYRFRQDPGPKNPLGVVKFMFPNAFDVYLHDTSSRELFRHPELAFSSGCIRLEKPLELAELLLRDAGWTRAKIDAAVASGAEQTVRLESPVPIHLLYWTAWADADGVINFRKDVYARDAPLASALRETAPEALIPTGA